MVAPRLEQGVGIWAEKLNKTTWFTDDALARALPATILCIKRGGNYVINKAWPERDGLYTVTVGYDRYNPKYGYLTKGEKKVTEMCANANLPPMKKAHQFRVRPQEWDKWDIGDKVNPSDVFKEGEFLHIHGRTPTKGFIGQIEAWGHKRGPKEHGSQFHRTYGSVGQGTTESLVAPLKRMPGWKGGQKQTTYNKILKIIEGVDEDNMPESIIVVKDDVAGYEATDQKLGGSYVYMHRQKDWSDGRFKRDKVFMWYALPGEENDPYKPIPQQAWTHKTYWGRDITWVNKEIRKWWPDGFPGYDHSTDPFYDGCDERLSLKAPEW